MKSTGKGTHEGDNRSRGSPEDVVTFSFENLRNIVLLDLQFTYSLVGKTILKQRQGAPIGGILSCFYANLVCAKKENEFINRDTLDIQNRIYGIRQVDDLVMWVAYSQEMKYHITKQNRL